MKQIYTILIVLSVCFLNLYSQDISNKSVGEILDRTGVIKPNTKGSFNTKGYKMTYGKNKEPIFSKINSPQGTSSYEWASVGSGRNGTVGAVLSMAVDESGNIYVGGSIGLVSDIQANCIAKWNGTSWSALTSGAINGVNGGEVTAIAISGNDVYVGGVFTTLGDGTTSANYIAKWNTITSTWSTLASGASNGVDSSVMSIAVSGSDVYVGGAFTMLGDGTTSANYIAKWNTTTSTWSTLASGESNGVNHDVSAIAVSGSDVYVGGSFETLADGSSANHIAKWNGTSWSTLASGVSNGVNYAVCAIATSGSDVYVGGVFTTLGDGTTSANHIAKWNGTTWSALTGSVNNGVAYNVSAIAVSGSDVYVGGESYDTHENYANSVDKWNGTEWSNLASRYGIEYEITAIAVNGTDVYTGGFFNYIDDNAPGANNIAKWNGSAWSAVGSGSNGVNALVTAIAISGSDVYVGGYFNQLASGASANYIAKWNTVTSTWSTLPIGASNGVNDYVYAIAVCGSDVYVGGQFTLLGDGTTSANNIAKWNTTTGTWSTLTSGASNGVNDQVHAIAVSGSDVYVGGLFNTLGDGTTSANCIAKWNTTTGTWSTLASGESNGVNNDVYAVATNGSDVYVGGFFNQLGDGTTSANGIAKWNGTTWSTLTSGASNGVNNIVLAIATNGSDVYVGGLFNTLGDGTTSANCIAKWNTTTGTWSTLPGGASNGVDGQVMSIAVSGSGVYVGGLFSFLGDGTTPANNIAKWDGSSLSAADNGVWGFVSTIKINPADNKVFLGGGFIGLNNTTIAFCIGTFTYPNNPLPVELSSFTSNTAGRDINLKWTTKSEINSNKFDIERSVLNNNEIASWTAIGSVKAAGSSNSPKYYSCTDMNLQSGRYQYRIKMIDNDGTYQYSSIENATVAIPKDFAISQNYPNPFNPSTKIDYQLPLDAKVVLDIYNIVGQKVVELVNQAQSAGYYTLNFGASNLSSGIYVYRLSAVNQSTGKNFSMIKKMMLIK